MTEYSKQKRFPKKLIYCRDMVTAKVKDSKRYYICDECGFAYEDKVWAEKCQDYCAKHHACSIDITRHATHLG